MLDPGGILGGVAFALEGGEGFTFFAAEGADGFGGAFAGGTVAGDLALGVTEAAFMPFTGGLAVGGKSALLSVLLALPVLRGLLPLLLTLLLTVLRLTGLLLVAGLLLALLVRLLTVLLALLLSLTGLLLGLGEGVLKSGLRGGERGGGGGLVLLTFLTLLLLGISRLLLAGIRLGGLGRLALLALSLLGGLSVLRLVLLIRGLLRAGLVGRRLLGGGLLVLGRLIGLRVLEGLLGLLEGGGGLGAERGDLVGEVLRLVGGLLVGLWGGRSLSLVGGLLLLEKGGDLLEGVGETLFLGEAGKDALEDLAKLGDEGFLAAVSGGVAFALQFGDGLGGEGGEQRAVDAFGEGLRGGGGIGFAKAGEEVFAGLKKGGEVFTDAGLVAFEESLAFSVGFCGGDGAGLALDGKLAGDEGFETAGGFLAELLDGDLAGESFETGLDGLLGDVGLGGGGAGIGLRALAEFAEAGGDAGHLGAAEGLELSGEFGEGVEALEREAVALEFLDQRGDFTGEGGGLGAEGLLVDAVLEGDGAEGVVGGGERDG